MEVLWGLCYKLQMMGVSVSGPSYIYGDNMSVIHNTQWPELTLTKKSNSVCYHAMHGSVATGESLTGHISTYNNPVDICMKLIAGGVKRDHLVGLVLYDICDRPWFVTMFLPQPGKPRLKGSLVTMWQNIRTKMTQQLTKWMCDLATKWFCTRQIPFAWGDWEKSHNVWTDS
jgi:hypothetical protein